MALFPGSFKTRLTLTITAVFIAAGAVLSVGQLLLLEVALNNNISQVSVGSGMPGQRAPGVDATARSEGALPSTGSDSTCTTGPVTGSGELGPCAESTSLWDELAPGILREFTLGSLALLVVFAAVTAGLAWWLTRRALSRVGEVTALANEISEQDLSRRLVLSGPRDEIQELADTINVMLARLQGAFESQERFVANASHELRGPLTASRAALEAPLAQGRFPEHVRSSIVRALEANRRSERLITALLQLARSRTLQEDESCDCNLADITAGMLEALAEDVPAQGLSVATNLPDGGAACRGHPTLLSQAVFNLLDNGIRHNVEHGLLSVSVGESVTCTWVSVENTGPTYTAKEAAELREPFHRGAQSRLIGGEGQEGIGLGLALVDSIAQAHGGRLDLAPRPGGGLHVALTLPRGQQRRGQISARTGSETVRALIDDQEEHRANNE